MAKIKTFVFHFLFLVFALFGLNTNSIDSVAQPANSNEQDWDDDDVHLFI